MGLNDLTNPRTGEMTLRVTSGSTAVEFERFLSYSYRECWLEPSDSWHFELDQKELSKKDLSVLVPGATVEPCIDGHVQTRGILDEVLSTASPSGGNVVTLEGRDWLSMLVDGQVDPRFQGVQSDTLLSLVTRVVEIAVPRVTVVADAIANRNVITGRIYGERTSKKGKPLRHVVLGEENPYPNEGLFTFASRVAQRFGLWIRPFIDGETIVLAGPDFEQAPRYGICHALDQKSAQNNVIRGHFARSRKDQPSILYAHSPNGGGGNFAKSTLRAGVVNPAVIADNSKFFDAYPDVKMIGVDPLSAAFEPFNEGAPRAAFLVDRESHTHEQLEAFLRRELSLRMRKAITARYEIMGHKLNGQPVAVDTIVSVIDQQPTVQWNGPLWVLGREFSKTPHGGARTVMDLILPGSIQF